MGGAAGGGGGVTAGAAVVAVVMAVVVVVVVVVAVVGRSGRAGVGAEREEDDYEQATSFQLQCCGMSDSRESFMHSIAGPRFHEGVS